MKFYNNLCFFLLVLVTLALMNVVVSGNDEEVVDTASSSETVDCNVICEEKIKPYIVEQTKYHNDKELLQQQYNDIVKERDTLINEIQVLRNELQQSKHETNEVRDLIESSKNDITNQYINEINELKKSIDVTNEDMKHYQKVAQDNQKYMQEYKNQLHTQRDKANKLNIALQEANDKIIELESMTFMKQLQKEIQIAWNAIVEYWNHLKNKGKTETDAEF